MISRLQREDHEFESRRNHSQAFWPSVKNLDQNFFSFFEKIFFYFIFWINFFINFNSIFLQWFRGLGVWYLAYNERITSSNLVGTTSQLFFFPWSRGMISRLQREDHEFESRRNHFSTFFLKFFYHSFLFN